jgi:hypothetical protein
MLTIACRDLLMLSTVVGKVNPNLFIVKSDLGKSRVGSDTSGTSVKHEYAKSTNFVLTLHVNF